MAQPKKYLTREVIFKTNSQPIDYFKIPVDELTSDGFKVELNSIPLASNEKISVENHLRKLDHSKEETVVLNIQVGKGKTTACYNLIQQYTKLGYKVIMVSPFKKLVEKDYTALSSLGLSIFQYQQLTDDIEDNFNNYIDCDVQIMTINCLLQNPGDDAYSQKFIKRNYLTQLYSKCILDNKKVIIIFDEIHESVHNFQRHLIPNLQKWQRLVHKCFIASATFTPASIPVLKYISTLTHNTLTVFETPRNKTSIQSELHIHFIRDSYSGSKIDSLLPLKSILEQNQGKQINILTGHKSIANALTDKSNASNEIVQALLQLNFNMTNGDDDTPFDSARNNIGTTFKTGVDMTAADAVLIIIFPCQSDNFNYGIFSDGLPSIIQSLARLRSKGVVHVITSLPKTIIDKSNFVQYCNDLVFDGENSTHKGQNMLYEDFKQLYLKEYTEKKQQIDALENLQSTMKVILNYSYPSIEEYLIDKSQNLLVKNHVDYGKDLSPYLLWAAINNQITNARLSKITYTSRKSKHIILTKENTHDEIKKLFTNVDIDNAKKLNLPYAVSYLINVIENNEEEVQFKLSNSTFKPNRLWNSVIIMQTLAKILYPGLSKESFVLASCLQSNHSLNSAWQNLERGRKAFISFMEKHAITNSKGELLIHKDIYKFISDKHIEQYATIIKELNQIDMFISNKVFPLIPKISDIPNKKLKATIYKELEKCFTNATGIKKAYDGRKDEYYLIAEKIEKTLPTDLEGIQIF